MAGGALSVAVVIGAGGAVAIAAGPAAPGPDTDSDAPLTGRALEQVTAAALAHTGGGSVTGTEVGDDGAAYGVEIRRPDGRHVEVDLDAAFVVVGEEADDGPDDD
jgi:hypothetical protein